MATLSIANDVAKYFATLPAIFAAQYSELRTLNLMRLAGPESAILSAMVFHALIIVAVVPLPLRRVRYTPMGAAALLRRSLLIYGWGGVVAPHRHQGHRPRPQLIGIERYFHPRPSAASAPDPDGSSKNVNASYNAAASTASPRGPATVGFEPRGTAP